MTTRCIWSGYRAWTGQVRTRRLLGFAALVNLIAGCASTPPPTPPPAAAAVPAEVQSQVPQTTAVGAGAVTPPAAADRAAQAAELKDKWGIEVTGLHLSADGHMVDFRYRVLDPDKAGTLSDPAAKPYLVDSATGAKLLVPRTPKIGPLRQSAVNPEAGRIYFVLFGNMNRLVKQGSRVSVVIGACRIDNLSVD